MATYTDFFTDFTAHPDTHDLAMKTDSRAIQQSLRNLVFTNQYERPYQSKLGGSVRSLVFSEVSPQKGDAIKKLLEELIKNHEPRVVLVPNDGVVVNVNPSGRTYDVWINYYELNNPNPTSFYIELKRTR